MAGVVISDSLDFYKDNEESKRSLYDGISPSNIAGGDGTLNPFVVEPEIGKSEDTGGDNAGGKNKDGNNGYGRRKTFILEMIYIVAIVVWMIVIFWIYSKQSERLDEISSLILSVPLVVYLISMVNVSRVEKGTEERYFAITYLMIGLLVVIPLLTWTHQNIKEYGKIAPLVIIAIILAILSVVDVWVPMKWIVIVKHVRSILQVAALTLIIYALYLLYVMIPYHGQQTH